MADQTTTIPKGWKAMTLDEVATVIGRIGWRGYTIEDLRNSGPLVIGGTQITGNILDFSKPVFITEEKYEESPEIKVGKDDIILTKTGNSIGDIAIVNRDIGKATINPNVALIRAKNSDAYYLFYLLISKEAQHYIKSGSTASAQPAVNQETIRRFEFYCPPISEQRAIAAVLSSLDDKIKHLREQNKTLEATAQAIFKEWFVNFNFPGTTGKMIDSELGEIPEGWRVGRLGDEFEIIMGQSPNGESYNEVQRGKVFFQGRAEFQDRFPKTRLYTTEPKRMAEKFDVLVSVRAPVGDINVAAEDCCIGRGLAAVRSINKSYTLYKIKSLKEVFGKFEAEGTVFGSINKDNFANVQVIIPVLETIRQFENVVSSLDEKIYINYSQIQILSKLRDTLLPKLMRGDVRVKGFEN